MGTASGEINLTFIISCMESWIEFKYNEVNHLDLMTETAITLMITRRLQQCQFSSQRFVRNIHPTELFRFLEGITECAQINYLFCRRLDQTQLIKTLQDENIATTFFHSEADLSNDSKVKARLQLKHFPLIMMWEGENHIMSAFLGYSQPDNSIYNKMFLKVSNTIRMRVK